MNNIEKRLEELLEKFKKRCRIGTMHLVSDFERFLKEEFSTSIQQAIAEERERVVGEIESWEKSHGFYVGAGAGQNNEVARKTRKEIIDSLDKLPDKDIKEMPQFKGTLEALDKLTIIK